jgi:outer membrane protein assembly factor BamD
LNHFQWTLKALLGLCTVLILLSGPGCSSVRRFDPTPEGEFEEAFYYYEDGEYTKSIEKFKDLIYKYPGSALVEQARYYLADAYYLSRDYILASSEFELLNREFPQGQFSDVALFKAGLAYASMGRRVERDQSESKKAMDTFQNLLTKYPNTEYADTVRDHLGLIQDKMAQKEYKTALFYYEAQMYDSAIIYLKSVISNYSESKVMAPTLYYLYLASRSMGYPDDAQDALAWLCRDYPQSPQAVEVCGELEEKEQPLTGEPQQEEESRQ